ncbi:hypothetical protein [Methylobacterium nodulans]|uniref:Uncharacterized protein n=1 Tax=Methylobacterium nodulans (strain LMG 21967 / CNCM I-2342 / ORS 2060) TaxID=460265 RepID=B8INY8_METNO|nr:hypothetical protein [Methylobacterium nodulans]ACL58504.1 hypothetical protein Mnod_3595 [Methylobacterium nodulans ORS 2060]
MTSAARAPTPFDVLGDSLPCRCPGMGYDPDLGLDLCACIAAEKALRAYRDRRHLPPMTDEQRAWCLSEIERAEGYERACHASETDNELAGTVLCAWLDFARDKGLVR